MSLRETLEQSGKSFYRSALQPFLTQKPGAASGGKMNAQAPHLHVLYLLRKANRDGDGEGEYFIGWLKKQLAFEFAQPRIAESWSVEKVALHNAAVEARIGVYEKILAQFEAALANEEELQRQITTSKG